MAAKKIKVSELSLELGKTPKELIKILNDLGVPVKTAASSVDAESAKVVRELVQPKKEVIIEIAKEQPPEKAEEAPPIKEVKKLIISQDGIVVKDLAEKIQVKVSDVIKELMKKKMLITLNQKISFDLAKDIASIFEYQIEAKEVEAAAKKHDMSKMPSDTANLKTRPPVVTIMGHVDHGKTKLLDAIRATKVAESEAGGITQHIGAYQVKVKGKKITFLDTPGHEAFTALRARGAKVTDIAILVVAADDGVMPQTIEAIDHAKAAGVPIIVAINKMDKPEANPDRIKQQLSEMGLQAEDWGGQTVTVPISAKQKTGIDELLDMILLVAEMLELKADKDAQAIGVIVESRLDKGMGPVASILIKTGTLRIGDNFVVGGTYGKVRALVSDTGERIKEAPPSSPVMVLGANDVPPPGELLHVVSTDQLARAKAEENKLFHKKVSLHPTLSLEDFAKEVKKGEKQNLNLILKTDVQGSLEALLKSLSEIEVSGLKVNILHRGVGNISESDILLAEASSAITAGFNVDIEPRAKERAETEGVEVRIYSIIYKMIDDIKQALAGSLKIEYEEYVSGKAEVRQTFKFSKVGVIAGCFVLSGKFVRGAVLRVFRGDIKIFDGKLESLKRIKEDVKEVVEGYECGIAIQGYSDFKAGDILECIEKREKKK
ncbi:MAG: infB [Candidatus Saganbacteria bacterium]|uniref:Translation initiation factor IF-2 n=1 Tax=Candidatus Saganbacteria bacterium TaxID=2575572 RepID=A0A833L191_UNCSA|nr:MAG: infB [Candidatus Saganbacteria bacterium]